MPASVPLFVCVHIQLVQTCVPFEIKLSLSLFMENKSYFSRKQVCFYLLDG